MEPIKVFRQSATPHIRLALSTIRAEAETGIDTLSGVLENQADAIFAIISEGETRPVVHIFEVIVDRYYNEETESWHTIWTVTEASFDEYDPPQPSYINDRDSGLDFVYTVLTGGDISGFEWSRG